VYILVAVVGHHFITLAVDICVQHSGRHVPRHAGLSAVRCFIAVSTAIRMHTCERL